jgi:peptidoglycan LD-endopeptidase CwlK
VSRDIEDLIPEMQEKFAAFLAKMEAANLPFMVTFTYRSQEEQDALYAQGRTAPGRIVTWTKNSRHTKREAFDIAMLVNGKPDWSDNKLYRLAGQIGESVGLVWGGRWKKADLCHFQNS